MFKYSAIIFSCLAIFRKFSNPCLSDVQFIKNIFVEDTLPISGQEFYLKAIKNRSRAECALQCLQLRSTCVGLVYSEMRSRCYLTKSSFNGKVLDGQPRSPSWEYWYKVDVCPRGWLPFDDHCYLFNKIATSWNDAKENCERENAYLVEVNTAKENDFLQSTYVQNDDSRPCIGEYACPVWIGANDIDTEGVFIWSRSKEKIVFSNWHPTEPSSHVPEQDCVTIVHEGLWDDTTCFSKIPFICEKHLYILFS